MTKITRTLLAAAALLTIAGAAQADEYYKSPAAQAIEAAEYKSPIAQAIENVAAEQALKREALKPWTAEEQARRAAIRATRPRPKEIPLR